MDNTTGGFGNTLGNLFQNKMFLQYLSAAGGAMSAGQPVGPAINQITQQNIASQSHLGLLKKMLGNYPAGSSMKVDNKGISLSIPHHPEGLTLDEINNQQAPTEADITTAEVPGSPKLPSVTPVSPTTVTPPGSNDMMSALSAMLAGKNPVDSISPDDLAGLSPSEISNAIGLKYTGNEMQLRAMDLARKLQPQPADMSPITTPDGTSLTMDQFKGLGEHTRNYYSYFSDAKKRGETPMSMAEWEKNKETTDITNWQRAKKEDGFKGSLEDWIKTTRPPGVIVNTAEKLAYHEGVKDIDARAKVTDPKFQSNITEDLMKDRKTWNIIPDDVNASLEKAGYKTDDEKEAAYHRALLRKSMHDSILQVYPEAVFNKDGWYVDGKRIVRFQ